MTNDEIVKVMIKEVEDIVREKVRDDLKTTSNANRKAVAKIIVDKLEKVIANEN